MTAAGIALGGRAGLLRTEKSFEVVAWEERREAGFRLTEGGGEVQGVRPAGPGPARRGAAFSFSLSTVDTTLHQSQVHNTVVLLCMSCCAHHERSSHLSPHSTITMPLTMCPMLRLYPHDSLTP